MEVQHLKIHLILLLIQDITNLNLVSQGYHLDRQYLLHVAHLGPQMHTEHEHGSPENQMNRNHHGEIYCMQTAKAGIIWEQIMRVRENILGST